MLVLACSFKWNILQTQNGHIGELWATSVLPLLQMDLGWSQMFPQGAKMELEETGIEKFDRESDSFYGTYNGEP